MEICWESFKISQRMVFACAVAASCWRIWETSTPVRCRWNPNAEEMFSRMELGTRGQRPSLGQVLGHTGGLDQSRRGERVGVRWTPGTLPEAHVSRSPETDGALGKRIKILSYILHTLHVGHDQFFSWERTLPTCSSCHRKPGRALTCDHITQYLVCGMH